MRVTNRANWLRTKVQAGFILFLIAIGFAGGLESDPTEPIPSVLGFVITMGILVALTIHIFRSET